MSILIIILVSRASPTLTFRTQGAVSKQLIEDGFPYQEYLGVSHAC